MDLFTLNVNVLWIDSILIIGAYIANSNIINGIIDFLGLKGILDF